MERREFLKVGGLALAGLAGAAGSSSGRPRPETAAGVASGARQQSPPFAGSVMTVLGPVSPGQLGSTLSHEHVLVDFVGADLVSADRYDRDEAFEVILPHLERARELGCRGFVECTPACIGRDPLLLVRLARATRLNVLTNTGYYGAADDKFVPAHARGESADSLAERWTKEWEEGIEGSGVRPGFIKTGVDAGPLSAIDRKLVQAAARTHARTGLTIASHTGNTRAGLDQLEVLAQEKVAAEAFIWVHAQSDWDLESRVDAARKGAWIEIDNLAPKTVGECAARATALKGRGLLERILVSHDAGWYSPGEPRGGDFRPFDTAYTTFLTELRREGWAEADIRQLFVSNPAAAFRVRIRRT